MDMRSLGSGVRSLFDRELGVRHHLIARWIFLRALGAIYLSAFLALLFQIRGMIGSDGILPADQYLQKLGALGMASFWYAPTLLWLDSDDHALMLLVWAGLLASLLVMVNVAPRISLAVCFVCFLSFIAVSQDFGQYQSDGMLLEAGFLSLFVAPGGWWPGWGRESLPIRAAWWLLLWEWFRIYFESGAVKLLSGDPTWRNLTAMYQYYQNGPLPTWIGWYLQHLPNWFHRTTAFATLAMELVLVWMAFLPRRWKIACFCIVTAWQTVVIATANYAFLNYLVLVLAFLLLDDRALERFVPRRLRSGLDLDAERERSLREGESEATSTSTLDEAVEGQRKTEPAAVAKVLKRVSALGLAVSVILLAWIAYATTAEMVLMFWQGAPVWAAPIEALAPFRIANQYGLFAVMTPHRYEIEFQGSDDGINWKPYLFRFKPQDVRGRPGIYAPYQPRFDWNLWFASLTSWQNAAIVPLTEERLLMGDKDVLSLFRNDPFPELPPRQVRAVLWQYWFSTPEEKRTEGVWWTRKLLGTCAPTLELLPDGRFREVQAPELEGPPGA
ncbi:MAG: lipase maturation factor family protein [Acidobacteriaceae bacterium]